MNRELKKRIKMLCMAYPKWIERYDTLTYISSSGMHDRIQSQPLDKTGNSAVIKCLYEKRIIFMDKHFIEAGGKNAFILRESLILDRPYSMLSKDYISEYSKNEWKKNKEKFYLIMERDLKKFPG